MSFATRGLIEGFYGRLWTWDERWRVLDAIGGAGFTAYVYAPKEDRLQNAGWRDPYPAGTDARLAELVRRCAERGMTAWFGMRPVGISYADHQDLDRLTYKLGRLLELGADRLVLLADDIPSELAAGTAGRFARLADAHVWLVETVLERLALPPERLVFVPTDYHGSGSPYLEELGRRLPGPVDLCWTGSGVFAPRITVVEAEAIGAVLRRPPLIWDNYPVNDDLDRHDLRIGPIRGREPGLATATRGILVNPAQEPEASLVPLLTWGEFLCDPDRYEPDAAWRRALTAIAGKDGDARAVATIAAAHDRSVLDQRWDGPSAAELAAALARLPSLANRHLAEDLAGFVAG